MSQVHPVFAEILAPFAPPSIDYDAWSFDLTEQWLADQHAGFMSQSHIVALDEALARLEAAGVREAVSVTIDLGGSRWLLT